MAGEPTVIEQNGKRAVLLSCKGVPEFELDPEVDKLLRERVTAEGREPSDADWLELRRSVRGE